MHSHKHKPPLLIKAQSIQIIIRRHQPQPPAAKVACHIPDHLDQCSTIPHRLLYTIQSYDLTTISLNMISNQPQSFTSSYSHKPRQIMRVVDHTVTDNLIGSPMFNNEPQNPIPIISIQWAHNKVLHTFTPRRQLYC